MSRIRPLNGVWTGSRVELNTATISDIERLSVMTPGLARALIASRPSKTWEELGKVKGFYLALIEDLVLSGVILDAKRQHHTIRETSMSDDREQTIRERAYSLWETDGRPTGREDEYWLRAERLIAEEDDPAQPNMTDIPPL